MAKTDDGKGDEKPGEPKGGGGALDEAGVRAVVSDVLGALFKKGDADVTEKGDGKGDGKGGRGRHDDEGGDIASQVERAVARVHERDQRTKAEQAREDRLKKLEEAAAKPEKVPRQLRRVTRFMWGGEDED